MYFNSCSDGLVLLVKGVMHSLFLRGGGGGGGGGRHVTHSSHNSTYVLFFYSKRSQTHYIMKYLDSHLYRLCWSIVGDGQSNLIM